MRDDLKKEFPNGFISETVHVLPEKYYQYRWTGDKYDDNDGEVFQILARNENTQRTEFQNANSIDFDF
jgi:hypothetical protein